MCDQALLIGAFLTIPCSILLAILLHLWFQVDLYLTLLSDIQEQQTRPVRRPVRRFDIWYRS